MTLYKSDIEDGGLTDYDVYFGIGNTLSGFIVRQETLDVSDIAHQVHDQYGRLINKISYDDIASCNFTFIGKTSLPAALAVGKKTFVYGGVTWHIESVSESGTFDGLRTWSVSATASYNYPVKGRAAFTAPANPTAGPT